MKGVDVIADYPGEWGACRHVYSSTWHLPMWDESEAITLGVAISVVGESIVNRNMRVVTKAGLLQESFKEHCRD